MTQRFFICEICGNMVGLIKSSGVPLVCCGQEMTELVGNSSDGAVEKHVPVVSVNGSSVTIDIGAVPHPMLEEHYIEWIYLKTEKGGQRKELKPGDEPKAEFIITDGDKALKAYAYCNLHGLWNTDIV
jgi:desulfoferrodoxin ferrous iron-binding domain